MESYSSLNKDSSKSHVNKAFNPNMGAASFLQMNLKTINYGVISRQPSASTATGFAKVHKQEQEEIIETAFSI